MWSIFRSKRERERQEELARKEREIQRIKANTLKKTAEATDAMRKLNLLVEEHGISGVIYFSTGRRKA